MKAILVLLDIGASYKLVDHILSEHEEDEIYQSALKAMPPLGKGIDITIHTPVDRIISGVGLALTGNLRIGSPHVGDSMPQWMQDLAGFFARSFVAYRLLTLPSCSTPHSSPCATIMYSANPMTLSRLELEKRRGQIPVPAGSSSMAWCFSAIPGNRLLPHGASLSTC